MIVGNAPVSFGVYEAGVPSNLPFPQVLDAIAQAGYAGTELGPYGYLPATPKELAHELDSRKLGLGSSYVSLRLADTHSRKDMVAHAVKVGALLASKGVKEVILADDGSPERKAAAGKVTAKDGWNDQSWTEAVTTLHACADALKPLGMRAVVHHHAGTFIETEAEIDRLLASTDPDKVNLLLDTGHCAYGGGDPLAVLKRHQKRVRYVHLKDVDPKIHALGLPMDDAWARGVFCRLGLGKVPMAKIVETLRGGGYDGWVIVEQDVVRKADGSFEPDPFVCAKQSRTFLREECGI